MGNGLAIASLILGILGIVFGWILIINIICLIGAIVGIILGVIYLDKAKSDPKMTAKGIAIAGIVLCIIAMLESLLVLGGILAYFGILNPNNMVPFNSATHTNITSSTNNGDVSSNGLITMAVGFGSIGRPSFSQNTIQATLVHGLDSDIKILKTGTFTSPQCPNAQISSITLGGIEISENDAVKSYDKFTITWNCPQPLVKGKTIRATFTIDYINTGTGVKENVTGMLSGVY